MPRKNTSRPRRKIIVKAPPCLYCKTGAQPDYKDFAGLGHFISERGKIIPAERTGLCPKHQRRLSYAVKRCRFLGLLPFVSGVR